MTSESCTGYAQTSDTSKLPRHAELGQPGLELGPLVHPSHVILVKFTACITTSISSVQSKRGYSEHSIPVSNKTCTSVCTYNVQTTPLHGSICCLCTVHLARLVERSALKKSNTMNMTLCCSSSCTTLDTHVMQRRYRRLTLNIQI